MDLVIPFDFFPLFTLIGPLAAKARALDLPTTVFATADDFIQGKRGTLIDEEIGSALFTVVDNLARTILNKEDFTEVDKKNLKILTDFTDYLKGLGIELETY